MTFYGVMDVILRYFTEFSSLRRAVHKSGWRCRRKKVHVRYFISWWVSCCHSDRHHDRLSKHRTSG